MSAVILCHRPECQTTAGCAYRGPRGEFCYYSGHLPNPPSPAVPHGCICPPGSEATCQGPMCPRRSPFPMGPT